MSIEQENDLIPAIRHWLAATKDVEIPTGLSREEASRQADELLAALTAGNIFPFHLTMENNRRDILWAAVDELANRPAGQSRFEVCQAFYQFASEFCDEADPLDEIGDILHRISLTGWSSIPGGVESTLGSRDGVWSYGNDTLHCEVCASADALPQEVQDVRDGHMSRIPELLELCSKLYRLSSIRFELVFSSGLSLISALESPRGRVGSLDDREYLTGVAAFAVAAAARQMGEWSVAEVMIERSRAAFGRTVSRTNLERLDVEELALVFAKSDFDSVCDLAPPLIQRLAIPKELFKARLVLGWTFLNLSRHEEARRTLEAALADERLGAEPAMRAGALSVLGMVFTYLGLDRQALESFRCARSILAESCHPLQEAVLTGALGEFVLSRGKPADALALYTATREKYRQLSQWWMVGYLSVLIAELMLFMGGHESAEAELRAALPLIEKLDRRREGVVAIGLLNQAIANKKTDLRAIQTLREQLQRARR